MPKDPQNIQYRVRHCKTVTQKLKHSKYTTLMPINLFSTLLLNLFVASVCVRWHLALQSFDLKSNFSAFIWVPSYNVHLFYFTFFGLMCRLQYRMV